MFDVLKGLQAGRALVARRLPHIHQGRDPHTGLDCSGLILHMLAAAGWQPRDAANTLATTYTREGSWQNIQQALDVEGYQIPLSCALPMDFYLLHWYGRKIPQHFMALSDITADGIYLIHTHENLEIATEHLMPRHLRRKIYCAFRFWGRMDNDPLAPDTISADLR